jgi:hypothetical protein
LRPQLVLEATNAPGYADWMAGFPSLAPPATAPDRNPDGDRLTNAEEFLFVRNPEQADSNPVWTLAVVPGGVTCTFPQRKQLPVGAYYVIETAPGLGAANWTPASGVEFSRNGDLGDAWLMRAFIPAAAAQSFYRFRIGVGP